MRIIVGQIISLEVEEKENEEKDVLLTFWENSAPANKFQTIRTKDEGTAFAIQRYVNQRREQRGDWPGKNRPSTLVVEDA